MTHTPLKLGSSKAISAGSSAELLPLVYGELRKHAAVCRKLGRWDDAIADLRSGGVPPRDPAAEARLVDLSAFYNLELGGDLDSMLAGIRTFDGTRFDARGCLYLASGKFYPNRVPREMLGIPVACRGRRVRLLHGASSLDFISFRQAAAPFLVAVTIE